MFSYTAKDKQKKLHLYIADVKGQNISPAPIDLLNAAKNRTEKYPYRALKMEVLIVLFVLIVPARQRKIDWFSDGLSVLQSPSDRTLCHCGQQQQQGTGPS